MRKILFPVFVLFIVSIITPIIIQPSLAAYDYISINNPFLQKIPVAIPLFQPLSNTGSEKELSREGNDLLSDTLTFTGYFKMIDHDAFLVNPDNVAIVAPNINFFNWRSIGAELLITGGIVIEDEIVKLELRLYDTFKERLLIGKRYTGRKEDLRRIIRKFAGDIIYTLTGDLGVFNTSLAFVSNGTGHKEIYTCDFDGHGIKQITKTKSISLSPAWSSDSKWIAYTSYKQGNPDLYIHNIYDKRGAVVNLKGTNISPAWRPGKFEFAATLSFAGDQEIYLLTGGGKIIKRVTSSWGIDVSPSWSPDGNKFAFVSDRSGNPQIYILDLETGKTRRLTYEGRYNTSPSWSPRGDRIAYVGSLNGSIDIFTIGIDGSRLTKLTSDSGNNESPSWSPDGNLIVFSSNREGKSRIYVMTSFGTDQRRLLVMPGEQTSPAWSNRIIGQ
ncbi:MAG: Tol-Pal system beta propeller repeat protein TolB [Desulfobacterales bacterium]|nr:Tol-Pal system beta propeller repeat protein TolB [Desulfobacterales bacterium]